MLGAFRDDQRMRVRRRPAARQRDRGDRVLVDPFALRLEPQIGRRMGVQHADRSGGKRAVRLDPAAGPRDLVDAAVLGGLGEALDEGQGLGRVEARLLEVRGH